MSQNAEPRRLPERPSLEQLRKQAKELLRRLRDSESADATLTDAQFRLARDYGFESWPKLVHHVECVYPPGLREFERLAERVSTAYESADLNAIREINWDHGTSFPWFRERDAMHRRLASWYASSERTHDAALADARELVAAQSGFDTWTDLVRSLAPSARRTRGEVFYNIDPHANTLRVNGPLSIRHWDEIVGVMRERNITGLIAGGITDAALERVTALGSVTRLSLGGSSALTDEGLAQIARLPRVTELDISGPRSRITDRGLDVLERLPHLRRFSAEWVPGVSDAGASRLRHCERLEYVHLMGTFTGDATVRALAGKRDLYHLKTGTLLTDAGVAALRELPALASPTTARNELSLHTFLPEHGALLLDGPITDRGLASLEELHGVLAVHLFWNTRKLSPAALQILSVIPSLEFIACNESLCDDAALRSLARMSRFRMLLTGEPRAGEDGFAALAGSRSFEYLAMGMPRDLTMRGFRPWSRMPKLRAIGINVSRLGEEALALLPEFPALDELSCGGFATEDFRHVARCRNMHKVNMGGDRQVGDTATSYLVGLPLTHYYASSTSITDAGLELLSRITTLEHIELEGAPNITGSGIALLARLPRLRKLVLSGAPGVRGMAVTSFPSHIHFDYWRS